MLGRSADTAYMDRHTDELRRFSDVEGTHWACLWRPPTLTVMIWTTAQRNGLASCKPMRREGAFNVIKFRSLQDARSIWLAGSSQALRGPRLLWTAGAEVFLDPKRAKTRRLLRSTPRYFIVPGHNPDHTCRDKI